MFKRKTPRKNYRSGQKARRRFKLLGRILLVFKVTATLAALAGMTGFFILVHDLLTQSDYFATDQVIIEGARLLTPAQVARQAGVHPGDNILAVNLTLVRKRLLAHPWIAAAEVSREIPSRLVIRIKEQQALAVVDFGQKFLINYQGQIFKEWEPMDPDNLPVISGLNVSDLGVYGQLPESKESGAAAISAPFKAVMQVLQLGRDQKSILPNRLVRRISVDRQIGLTLYAFDSLKVINLGYSDYSVKYHMLANLFSYLNQRGSIYDFDRIDLNNLHRIVVNPINKVDSGSEGS